MLALRRKKDQAILIGKDIKIQILSVRWDDRSVVIGIDAPKDVRILREEVLKDE